MEFSEGQIHAINATLLGIRLEAESMIAENQHFAHNNKPPLFLGPDFVRLSNAAYSCHDDIQAIIRK